MDFNSNLNNLFTNYQKQQQYKKKSFDVNGDGKISSKDKSALTNEAKNLLKNKMLFDVNGDGKLTQADVDMFVKSDFDGNRKTSTAEKNFVEEYKDDFIKAFKSAKADFEIDGVRYVDGKEANGQVGGKYYKKGLLANGKYSGCLYENGLPFNGLDTDGQYYKNGKVASGTYQGKTYKNGLLYVNNQPANGIVDGKYYKKGKFLTGKANGITYKDGVALTIDKVPAEYKPITNINFSTLKQSSVGECGPLSTIMALYATENGKKHINNAVKKNANGDYIITFKNPSRNYIISKDEIQTYRASKPAEGSFAVADDAILAIELASAKVDGYNENAQSKSGEKTGLVYDMEYKRQDLASKLTGSAMGMINMFGYSISFLQSKINSAIKKGNTALMINVGGNNKTINCIGNPSTFKVTGGGHFIAITGISADGKTVTLTDPVDGSKQYKVSIEELFKVTAMLYSGKIKG